MSGMVYRRRGGVLVAEQAQDFASLERALKAFDTDLVLNVEIDAQSGLPVYEVHKIVSQDRPAILICSWRDETGTPLPLSSGLVDEVKRLHPSSRSSRGGLDTAQASDRRNAELRDEAAADMGREIDEIVDDLLPRITGKRIPVLHRGVHLRRSRHKPGGRWTT